MGENDTQDQPAGGTEQPEEGLSELKKYMAEIDKLIAPPEVRAAKLWAALGDKDKFNAWDLACFCAETLGYLLPMFQELEVPIKQLNLAIYAMHYQSYRQIQQLDRNESLKTT